MVGGGGEAVHQGRVRLSLIDLFISCKIRFLGLDQCYYLALIVQFKVMHYIMITKEKCLSCVTLDRKVPGSSPICGHFGVPNWLIKGLVVCKIVLGRRYFLLCFLYSDRPINFAQTLIQKKCFLFAVPIDPPISHRLCNK